MEPLLERDAELTALQDVVRGLAPGRGRLVLVGGEAGIGKTTLVRALRARADERVAFVAGACEALSVPVPLAPVRELAEALGVPDPAEGEATDRLLVARGLLEALAARAPAVAVIEDAHWADPTTLDVLRLLARRVEQAPVALLITYRDDELAAHPALAQLLGDLATNPCARRVALRPLSRAAVRELAEPAGLDATRLSVLTGGNPFLVVEAVAAGGRLPASVRDAALARASRLSPAARGAVGAAAVVGQRVPPALLEAVAPGASGVVEEALAGGVMVADGEVLGFRHELTREAIEAAIPPPRRAALHARVVAALAARREPADHARLAHHAELAGLVAEASRYAALAAAEAEQLGALREASLQAERALRLGSELTAGERLDLLLRHSHAANFASTRLEDAQESAEAAIALASRIGDAARHGRAHTALAAALWSLDRTAEARQAAQRGVSLLEGAGDAVALARAEATLVRMEATSFDPATAIGLGQRALAAAERAGLAQTRLDVEISLGLARGHCGDPGALVALEAAARAARAARLPVQTVRAHVNLVFVAMTLRDHARVDAAAADALALFEEHQTPIPGYAVDGYRARSLLDRGRWEDAEAIAAIPGRNLAADAPVVLALQGLLAARRGEPRAVALLDAAWAALAGVPESSRHGTVGLALVEAAWLRGDRAAALGRLQAARDSPAAGRYARADAELAVWAARHGMAVEPPANAPEPVAHELAGDWRRAIKAWQELEAPYEAALAALPGDERAAREALATLHGLGADAAARAFARDRTAAGAPALRGPRRSTRVHPAGLTRREQEVLDQLATGATNAGIAAALHLSERTVAHHVSSILGKLGAANRVAAIERARARGLVLQDGQGDRPT
jgi:DNA-binding CsgD family transcriptional regulator